MNYRSTQWFLFFVPFLRYTDRDESHEKRAYICKWLQELLEQIQQ